MADTVDKETRSKIMSRIRGKNTTPEILLRKELFAHGFRYRLHDKKLPGKPDIVFPKFKAVIFVHGCFWHGHNCSRFRMPESNLVYWSQKIKRNQTNDAKHRTRLRSQGWRVMTVWECTIANGSGYGRAIKWLNRLLESQQHG